MSQESPTSKQIKKYDSTDEYFESKYINMKSCLCPMMIADDYWWLLLVYCFVLAHDKSEEYLLQYDEAHVITLNRMIFDGIFFYMTV